MIQSLSSWFAQLVTWLTDAIFALGYPGIAALMALESSFFPFPSEVVLPPAGYLAAQGRMNPFLALGAGVFGSVAGAVFNYVLAVRLGRPLLHRYGRYLLIRESALDRAESFFRDHGEISTFVGRLVPVIRQYISLPAGLSRMRLDLFALYTALGAGIWCAILTWVGWYLGKQAEFLGGLPPGQVHRYATRALLLLAPFVAGLVIVYVVRHRRRTRQT
jgi:membrane protein DedA with SNARE-associated domain